MKINNIGPVLNVTWPISGRFRGGQVAGPVGVLSVNGIEHMQAKNYIVQYTPRKISPSALFWARVGVLRKRPILLPLYDYKYCTWKVCISATYSGRVARLKKVQQELGATPYRLSRVVV
jgi:hypothetical protein